MQSPIRIIPESQKTALPPALSSQEAFDLARRHLQRGAQEDYIVWTMIAEFLEAVEKQALRALN